MKGKILYYPILPDTDSRGSERSNDIRKWIKDFLLPAGIVTLNEDRANAYLVATGDGGFMATARAKHRQDKILVGINRGTFGFLLNPIQAINQLPKDFSELTIITLGLIQGKFIDKHGQSVTYLAFNDIFCGGDVADFITFKISGTLLEFPARTVHGNGVIISTPQGTSAYALSARGTAAILPLDSKHWFISGVATGPYPADHVSPQRIVIEIDSRNPVNGYADGKMQTVKDIERIIVNPTDLTVKLGFLKDIDFAARRMNLAQKLERGG